MWCTRRHRRWTLRPGSRGRRPHCPPAAPFAPLRCSRQSLSSSRRCASSASVGRQGRDAGRLARDGRRGCGDDLGPVLLLLGALQAVPTVSLRVARGLPLPWSSHPSSSASLPPRVVADGAVRMWGWGWTTGGLPEATVI
jgi:hypothetical protein